MKREAGDFAAHGVESAENDSLRSVVDNDFDSGSGFEGTYVSAFTPDYAAFDFVAVDMEYRYRIFDSCFSRHSLDCLNHNAFGFFICSQLSLVHNIVYISGSGSLGFVAQRFDKAFFGCVRCQT